MRSNAVTGQHDRQDKRLTGQLPNQSGHCRPVFISSTQVTKLNYFTANALFLEVHLTQCKKNLL